MRHARTSLLFVLASALLTSSFANAAQPLRVVVLPFSGPLSTDWREDYEARIRNVAEVVFPAPEYEVLEWEKMRQQLAGASITPTKGCNAGCARRVAQTLHARYVVTGATNAGRPKKLRLTLYDSETTTPQRLVVSGHNETRLACETEAHGFELMAGPGRVVSLERGGLRDALARHLVNVGTEKLWELHDAPGARNVVLRAMDIAATPEQFAKTWRFLGDTAGRAGDIDEAVRCYKRYLQLSPDAPERGKIMDLLEAGK